MIVNSVIQSANLCGGARPVRRVSPDSAFSNIRVFMVAGEFRVDAAVVDEDIANGPREDGNATRTRNSIGSKALSPVVRRTHSFRFRRQHPQPCAA
jgi:hypothetical protein